MGLEIDLIHTMNINKEDIKLKTQADAIVYFIQCKFQ